MTIAPTVTLQPLKLTVLLSYFLFLSHIHGVLCAKERVKCRTSLGNPGDWSEDNWILVYSNAQPDQMDNPSLALYGDDWEATKAAYPLVAKRALRVKRSLARAKYKVEKGKWTRFQPYTRICVPSPKGLAEAGLLPDDFVIRMNPTGPETDATADLFYKAFIRHGRIWSGYAGRSQH